MKHGVELLRNGTGPHRAEPEQRSYTLLSSAVVESSLGSAPALARSTTERDLRAMNLRTTEALSAERIGPKDLITWSGGLSSVKAAQTFRNVIPGSGPVCRLVGCDLPLHLTASTGLNDSIIESKLYHST